MFNKCTLLLTITCLQIISCGCNNGSDNSASDFPKTELPPSDDFRAWDPIWSEDGQFIYFAGEDSSSGASIIYSYNTQTKEVKKRYNTGWYIPKWRKGTNQIVAMQQQIQAYFNVFNTETGEYSLMGNLESEFYTSKYGNHKFAANFIPDTDTVFFTFFGTPNSTLTGIYSMDISVGSPKYVAEILFGMHIPNSTLLVGFNDATVSTVNNHAQIVTIDRNDGTTKYLTDFLHNPDNGADGVLAYLDISPDGTRMVFRRGFDLWLVDINGENLERISNVAQSEFGASTWSPNGEEIVTSIVLRPQVGNQKNDRIYIYNLKNKAFRPLFPITK